MFLPQFLWTEAKYMLRIFMLVLLYSLAMIKYFRIPFHHNLASLQLSRKFRNQVVINAINTSSQILHIIASHCFVRFATVS